MRALNLLGELMTALRFGTFVAGLVGLALLVIWPASPTWGS